jgi:hypothetical protein
MKQSSTIIGKNGYLYQFIYLSIIFVSQSMMDVFFRILGSTFFLNGIFCIVPDGFWFSSPTKVDQTFNMEVMLYHWHLPLVKSMHDTFLDFSSQMKRSKQRTDDSGAR